MMGSGNRPLGVGVPQGQRTPDVNGTPRTVTHLIEAKTYAVQFFDDDGTPHHDFIHCIGGIWYRAPNGENYAASLRRVNPTSWFVKKCEAKLADAIPAAHIPEKDAVDVLPEGGEAPAGG
jgi:hypothetical protein